MNEEGSAFEAEDVSIAAEQPQLGEMLIAARERWNLSAADLARQLRLALRQVQALEENRFEDLPGNTFVRGFIRNYARVVQSDAQAFLDAYECFRPQLRQHEIERSVEQIAFPSKTVPQWMWYLGVLLLLLLVSPLLIYWALHDDTVTPAVVKPAASVSPAPQFAQDASVIIPSPPAVLQSIPDVATGAPVAIAPSAQATPATTRGAASVQLRFDGDAWVEVRDKSGKVIFSQLNHRGDVQVVQGKPPFSLVVGNAAQVKIAYNDTLFDLAPHIKVNVARFKLE